MNTPTAKSNTGTTIGIILVVLLAVIAGAYFMDASRGTDTKLGNATEAFVDEANEGRPGTGLREASEEMRDRSTTEKMGDAIGDAGRDIQDAAE